MEKKQKKIDQQIAESKSKFEAKEAELEDARREARNYNTEVCGHVALSIAVLLSPVWLPYAHV